MDWLVDSTQRIQVDIEKKSQEIIKCELAKDAPSYEEIKSMGGTGFLHDYLRSTKNDETMTTISKFNIVQALSKNDLPWGLKLRLNSFKVSFYKNYLTKSLFNFRL